MGNTVKYAVVLDDKMSEALKALGVSAESVDDDMKALIAASGGLSKAEVDAAIAIKQANAALEAKARLLGVTTGEVKAMQAAEARLAETQRVEAIKAMQAKMKAIVQQREAEAKAFEESVRDAEAQQAAQQKAVEDAAAAEKKATEDRIKAHNDAADAAAKAAQRVVVAFAAIAAAAASTIKKLADTRNMFNDLSVETGIAASTLQGFDLAARAGGDSLEQLAPSLKQFGKRIRDAMLGTGEAKKAFDRLGISVKNSDGSMKDADTVLREVARKMQGIESATERAALVNDLFGESGGRILKIFNEGAGALDAYSKRARALGVDLEAGSKGAAKLQVKLAELETKLLGSLDKVSQLFGGEGSAAAAIDGFIVVLTYVEELLLSNARNLMNFLNLYVKVASTLPRLIKAAWDGESIKDVFLEPFQEFAAAIENPLTKAEDAVVELFKSRDEMIRSMGGSGGKGGGKGGGQYTPATVEETQFASSGAPLTGGQLKAAQDKLATFANEYSVEILAVAEKELGTSLTDLQDAINSTTDIVQLSGLVDFVGDFEKALKDGEKVIEDRTKAEIDATKEMRRLADETARAAEEAASKRFEAISSGVGAALGGPSGITSAIGAAGPQGAIVAQVVGALEAIGSAEPGQSPLDMVVDLVENVTKGLEKLGPILAKVLPKLLTDSLPALIKAIPDALVVIVDEAIPALLEAVGPLIEVLITEVIPALATYKARILEAVVTSVLPALMGALKELVKQVINPQSWKDASTSVRKKIGMLLGNIVAEIIRIFSKTNTMIKTALANIFTVEWWTTTLKELIAGLVESIRSFEFNTVGLDAFRQSAGFDTSGPTGLRGLAERAGDRFGGMNLTIRGDVYGDDRAFLKRIRDTLRSGKTGVSF